MWLLHKPARLMRRHGRTSLPGLIIMLRAMVINLQRSFLLLSNPARGLGPKKGRAITSRPFFFSFFRRAARKREKKTSLNTSEIRVSLSCRPLLLLVPGHSGILLFYFFFSLFAPLPVFHLLVIQETSEKRWLLLNRKSYTPRQHK